MLAGLVWPAVLAQDTRPEKTPEQVVEHLLGTSPTTRRQALAWAKEHPKEVVPVLVRALAGPRPKPLPYDAIRPLGEIPDPRVGDALVALVRDPSFPWKPQALEALADLAFPGAIPLFAAHAGSPVARSRAASVRGIGALGMKSMDGLVSGRIGDEEASVRLEAAKALIKLDDYTGIPGVIRDLSLDRRFADADPGSVARDAAAVYLAELGAESRPLPAPVATQADLASMLSFFKAKLQYRADKFPETIVPHEPDVPASFRYAVEVRSCVEGDVFLRFDSEGRVVLGRDLLRWFEVPRDATAPIVAVLQAMDTGPRGRRIAGPVTCDFERLAIRDDQGWRTLVIGTGRGEAPLRPLDDAVIEVLRRIKGPDWAEAHARRVAPFRAAPDSRPDSRPGAK